MIFGLVMSEYVSARTPNNICSDTDSGIVPETKGNVFGYSMRIPFNISDYCVNSGSLREYYCNSNRYNYRNID
jgi:hypothetical protein